ncbi:hypothetical protein [Streptomyces sp. NPDC088707]|uniref:hypothetical protein n=1 Tax=Streptomyces sp. NPDC088707 TaxID=3365871 RepID=UPI00382F0203
MPITTPPPFVLSTGCPSFAVRRSPAELEAENALLRAEVKRLRAGEVPCDPFQPLSTGGNLLWVLGNSSADIRRDIAQSAVRAMEMAEHCAVQGHDVTLRSLRARTAHLEEVVERTRAEAKRLAAVSDGTGRGVALTLGFVLAQNAGGRG